jgi:hypothetical protein
VAPPEDLALWGLHGFCLGARVPPTRVIRMDDNGRLLWRAQHGASRAELGGTDSQIALLAAFGLIEDRGGDWHSTVPLLEMASLRARMAGLAQDLAGPVAAGLAGLTDLLSARGCAASAPAVLFGHGLDGRLWDVLRGRGLLPDTTLTLDHPFWRGAVWAVWPPVPKAAGLNVLAPAGAPLRLCMVWTEATLAGLRALAAQQATGQALLAGAAEVLVLPGGRVPVLRAGDAADIIALDLAHQIADRFLDAETSMAAQLPAEMAADLRRVALGHELIWQLAGRLGLAGLAPGQAVYAERTGP